MNPLARAMVIGKGSETAGDLIDQGRCPMCSGAVTSLDFNDALSVKEFHISGMCQGCQDATFGHAPKSRQEVLDAARG
jgi:hypothetical protein